MPPSSVASGIAFAFAVVLFLLINERPAHAYIDPGSGSLVYQTALTLLLGAGFFFRRTLASIGRLFRGRETDTTHEIDPQGREPR
jgi:hypothetical protein